MDLIGMLVLGAILIGVHGLFMAFEVVKFIVIKNTILFVFMFAGNELACISPVILGLT
jgi:hypothetical protein